MSEPRHVVATRRDRHGAWIAILLLAAAIHGAQVADLGLYWDDLIHYLQGHHAARGDWVRFVTSDTSGNLRTERPLQFAIVALARAAYATSVPCLHGLLVLLMAVAAMQVARLARSLNPEPLVAPIAAALFLAWPLSPLQPAWGATVHYQGSLILALTVMLAAERLVERGERSVRSFLPAAAAYLASLLMHEVFFLLPLAWLAGLAAWPTPGAAETDSAKRARRASSLLGLGVLLGIVAIYALWRHFVLPIYGAENYPTPTAIEPLALGRRALAALGFGLWPWDLVRRQLMSSEILLRPVVAATLAALVCGASLLRAQAPVRPPAAGPSERWGSARGLIRAALLVLAAAATRAAVPSDANDILGISSRLNFVTLPAVVLLFAAIGGGLLSTRVSRARFVRPLLATAVAAAVAAGAFVHGTVKEQLVRDWQRLLVVLDTIRAQAPALADDTFVVVAGDAFQRLQSHNDTSSLFMALYDDQTLMANDLKRLRAGQGGIVSLNFGRRTRWFRDSAQAVILVDSTEPLPDVALERVVLFRSRGAQVAVAQSMTISRGRERIVLRHHPERVLDSPARPSRAWLHLDSTRVRSE